MQHVIREAWESTVVRYTLFAVALAGAPAYMLSLIAAAL